MAGRRNQNGASNSPPMQTWQGATASFVAMAAVYLASLAPDLATTHDGGELATAAVSLGVAHPPGYPLFTLLGHLFSLVPVASLVWRVNLFCALAAALGVTLFGLCFARLFDHLPAGLLAAAVGGLAVAPWRQAVGVEKYALHFVLAGALCCWAAYRRHGQAPNWPGALLVGLALCHHHTILLFGPALLVYLWGVKSDQQPWWRLPAALAVGLLPLLYLPLRASMQPRLNWGDPSSLERLLWVLLRRGYGTGVLSAGHENAGLGFRLGYYFQSLALEQFSWGILLLVLAGAYLSWRDRQRGGLLLGLAWFFTGPFFAVVAAQPPEAGYLDILDRFYAVSYLVAAGFLARLLAEFKPPQAIAAGLLLGLVNGAAHWSATSQAGSYHLPDTVALVWQTLPPDALLIPASDMTSGAYLYEQVVLGKRPDVQVIHAGLLASEWYRQNLPPDLRKESLKEVLAAGRPAYFEAVQPEIPGFFVPRGLVYEYLPPGAPIPERQPVDRETFERLEAFPRRGDWRQQRSTPYLRGYLLQRWANAYQTVAESLAEPQAEVARQRARTLSSGDS